MINDFAYEYIEWWMVYHNSKYFRGNKHHIYVYIYIQLNM